MKKAVALLFVFLFIVIVIVKITFHSVESQTSPHDWGGIVPSDDGEYIIIYCPSCENDHVFVFEEIRLFDEHLIEIYEETLNAMFDDEWTILSEEKIIEEIDHSHLEYLHCKWVQWEGTVYNYHHFYQWEIEYFDASGNSRIFLLHNQHIRGNFSAQIRNYITDFIAQYYQEHFLHPYLEESSLASSRISVFFSRMSTCEEAHSAWEDYQRFITTSEGAIPLTRLTPENVFEIIPVNFSIHISLNEYLGIEQSNFEEYAEARIEEMISSMIDFTNGNFTAFISARTYEEARSEEARSGLGARERLIWWYYIQGERVYTGWTDQFSRDVFEVHRGVFW